MPLRIAIVTQAYHPAVGGVTEHVAGSARALRRRGHDVTIVTTNFGSATLVDDARDGLRVLRIGRNVVIPFNGAENNLTVGFNLSRKLASIFAPGGTPAFDVVHVHCPVSPLLPLLAIEAADASGIPLVGTFHTASDSDYAIRLFRTTLRRFAARLSHAIAVSKAARDYAGNHFPNPMTVLPNGVDLDRFRPEAGRLARYDDGVPNLLFVGRFDPRKGLPELMHACGTLAREGRDFRLILVGDGTLRRQIERMAGGVLRGRVHFEGRVAHERLPAYYASADLFCSPARGGESFGMVLLEAMALGVPVLTTDLPGHRSVVTPGHDGVLVPRRDATALAAALARLLDDPAERRRLGENGLRTAAHFGWDDIAGRLEAIYASVVPAMPEPPREVPLPEDSLLPAGV
jgi:phosphatidyl-myo-inositol alpha-mannosyltransferase